MKKLVLVLSLLSLFISHSLLAKNTDTEIVKVDASNYQETIEEGLVLVDYWAPWCAPCRRLAPVLKDLATDEDLSIRIAKLNVDENKEVAVQKGIQTIPTLILYKDGKEVTRFTGVHRKQVLKGKIFNALRDE